MKKFLSIILAVVIIASLLPATFMTAAAAEGEDIEYVFTLGAFNSDKMITGASSAGSATDTVPYYGAEGVLSPSGTLYYRPAMHWNYTVPAKYSATDPQADFPAMNLDATAPWAFEAHRANLGSPYISGGSSGAYFFEYAYNSYTGTTPSFVAFRLKVDNPGIYDVQVLSSNRQTDSPVTAVYLFKDGTDGVTNADVSTYPSSAKLGYYDLYNALKRYKTVGENVRIDKAGEYIIAFVGDAESQTRNTITIGTTPQQRFYLSGVKFVFKEAIPDVLETIDLASDKTELELGKDEARLSVSANYTTSGAKSVAASDVAFSVAPEGVVSVSEDGVVSPIALGTATITATYADKTDSVSITVKEPEPYEHEFVFGLSAFNKDKMVFGADNRNNPDVPYYMDAPVLRNTSGGVLQYTPAMHWDYTVPAKYSNTDPQAEFKSMNLSATEPWAFEAHKINWGTPILYDSYYYFEYIRNSYITETPSFVAFKVKVGAPGTYDLSVLSQNRQTHSPVTAVYFFKNGTAGVTNSDISTYPSSAKLGYYDLYNALKRYKKIGDRAVRVEEPGEYIVAFVGDEQSYEKNQTTSSNSVQMFYLSGIKLTPVADELTSISISSANTDLEVGDNAVISAKANYSASGASALSASNVEFSVAPEGVVSVSSLGTVTALSAGTATVTATLKSDPTKTATFTFNVTAPEANEEITGDTVSIALTAIVDGAVSAEAKALISESSITAGNVNSVAVGSTVTLKAADSDDLKFLYWYNGNSGRVIADTAEYSFKAGTNLPIYAKYADANAELVEYFNKSGELISESEGTFNAEPDIAAGSYYKLFKDVTAAAVKYCRLICTENSLDKYIYANENVKVSSSNPNFVAWTKNGKVVSYNNSYSFISWNATEELEVVTDGEESTLPGVALFAEGENYMLELVNCNGVEIIEKGIIFAQNGTPTVDTCYAKVVANDDTNQFAASSEYGNARAYIIYKDGTSIKVAYSK